MLVNSILGKSQLLNFEIPHTNFGLHYMFNNWTAPALIKVPEQWKNAGNVLKSHLLQDRWSFRAASGENGNCGQLALSTSWGAICRKNGWHAPTPQELTEMIRGEDYAGMIMRVGENYYAEHQDEWWNETWLSASQLMILVALLGKKHNVSAQLGICSTESIDTKAHILTVYGADISSEVTVFIHHNGSKDGKGHWSGFGPKQNPVNAEAGLPSMGSKILTPQALPSARLNGVTTPFTTHGNHLPGRAYDSASNHVSDLNHTERFRNARLSEAEQKQRQQDESRMADERSTTLREAWIQRCVDFQGVLFELRCRSRDEKDRVRDENLAKLEAIEDRMRHLEATLGTRKGRACALAWLQVLGRGPWLHRRLLKNKELAYILKKNPKNVTTTATNKQRIVYPDEDDFERSRAAHKASTAITNVLNDPSTDKMSTRRKNRQGQSEPRQHARMNRAPCQISPTCHSSELRVETPASDLVELDQISTPQAHAQGLRNNALADMRYAQPNHHFSRAINVPRAGCYYEGACNNTGASYQRASARSSNQYMGDYQSGRSTRPHTSFLPSNIDENGIAIQQTMATQSLGHDWNNGGAYQSSRLDFMGVQNAHDSRPSSSLQTPSATVRMNGSSFGVSNAYQGHTEGLGISTNVGGFHAYSNANALTGNSTNISSQHNGINTNQEEHTGGLDYFARSSPNDYPHLTDIYQVNNNDLPFLYENNANPNIGFGTFDGQVNASFDNGTSNQLQQANSPHLGTQDDQELFADFEDE